MSKVVPKLYPQVELKRYPSSIHVMSTLCPSDVQVVQNVDNSIKGSRHERKVQFFLTLFKRPLAPPPLSFEHYVVNFSEGILTRLLKRMSQQLSTK